ncbi:MAG: hypothetical protein LC792_28995 [Actinobacteria bacterium]|nr:hypothetical protein [Actinomycetota bacterium]
MTFLLVSAGLSGRGGALDEPHVPLAARRRDLVVATTSDGTSMATDSVRFDEAHNRWSTHPAEAEAAGAFRAQSADPAVMTFDRPAVMTLHRASPQAQGRFEAMGSKPKICYMKKQTQDAGVTRVTVGELDLTNNWGGQFNYTDTNTSTVEAGFKYEGEGGWSAGGSTSFAKEGSAESINPVDPEPSHRHFFYRADMMFSTFRMDCGGRTAYELRPTFWTGGMRPEPAPLGWCDNKYVITVGPKSTFARQDGSSQTFSGAFSIAGFGGSASSTNSKSVRHEWRNGEPRTRELCGMSNHPVKDTRVVSIP